MSFPFISVILFQVPPLSKSQSIALKRYDICVWWLRLTLVWASLSVCCPSHAGKKYNIVNVKTNEIEPLLVKTISENCSRSNETKDKENKKSLNLHKIKQKQKTKLNKSNERVNCGQQRSFLKIKSGTKILTYLHIKHTQNKSKASLNINKVIQVFKHFPGFHYITHTNPLLQTHNYVNSSLRHFCRRNPRSLEVWWTNKRTTYLFSPMKKERKEKREKRRVTEECNTHLQGTASEMFDSAFSCTTHDHEHSFTQSHEASSHIQQPNTN